MADRSTSKVAERPPEDPTAALAAVFKTRAGNRISCDDVLAAGHLGAHWARQRQHRCDVITLVTNAALGRGGVSAGGRDCLAARRPASHRGSSASTARSRPVPP